MGEGLFNCSKLWDEIKSQGHPGGKTILKEFVKPYRDAQRGLATVRFETGPRKQAHVFRCQMNAFRYFGSVPEEVLVDNLKSAVMGRDGPRVRAGLVGRAEEVERWRSLSG